MTCREYREDLVEWARGSEPARALAVHVAECAGCAHFLEEQRALSAVLQRVAAQAIPSPAEIGARVMAEFDRGARNAPGSASGVGSLPEAWLPRPASRCW